MNKLLLTIVFVLTSTILFAQITIKGKITDASSGEPLPGASILIVGKNLGTTSDFDGNYSLTVNEKVPFIIEVSNIGFQSITAEITDNNQTINFSLQETAEILDEIVISASRTPERIRESPVTIERMDAKIIQTTSSPSFYDGLANLKGVDVNANSLTFKSVNTRGFATFYNNRFVQLVDGVDNSSPALNFVFGNLIGLNELDVNTIEILPGASSALYGANAFNGILFMTSKDPFKYTGVSSYLKTGKTIQDAAGDNTFYDVGIRIANKFSNKVAAKANIAFLKGTDWWATDYNQYTEDAIGKPNIITPFNSNDEGFDALNRYGDEVATTLDYDNITGAPAGTFGAQKIARTGYNEVDLVDYNAKSVKANFAIHFKPWENDKEFIFDYHIGKGNTITQGANRYDLKDFTLNQMKLEFRGKNFFIRGYRTIENAGDSYDIKFTAINMNRKFKDDKTWFTDYASGYLGLYTGTDAGAVALAGALGLSPGNVEDANAFARMYADNLTPYGPMNPAAPSFAVVGTPEFRSRFNEVTSDPSILTGSKFVDKSTMHHIDANYNLSEIINEWGDLQIGGSFREYGLNSSGTIFTDYDGAVKYDEYGAYIQLSKKSANERLKFTGSARYDKGQNFDGNISPRVALVYSAGENKNHNFRASFQTGFRNPTAQNQYVGFDTGVGILIGSTPDNLDRYISRPFNTSATGVALGFDPVITFTGRAAYENAFTLSSVQAFGYAASQGTIDPSLLKKSKLEYVAPETVTAYELGYRGKLGAINIDLNGYFNQYEGFISSKIVIAPHYGQVDLLDIHPAVHAPNAMLAIANDDYTPFVVYTNSSADISSLGGTFGMSTKLFKKYRFGLNYTYAKFDFNQASDPDYKAGFNTPKHKFNANLGTDSLFNNVGFNLNFRWQDKFLWQSYIADAIVPSRTVVDAQISYKIPSFKSLFKVGGANIGGKNYMVAPGSALIGSQYFISWTINP